MVSGAMSVGVSSPERRRSMKYRPTSSVLEPRKVILPEGRE